MNEHNPNTKIQDVKVGDLLDLQHDPWAECDDPTCDCMEWTVYEYGVPEDIKQVHGASVEIVFTNGDAIAWPWGAMVRVDKPTRWQEPET